MTSREGVPLAVILTAANQHDIRQIMPLVLLEFPQIGGLPGRPLDRPRRVRADAGYASSDLLHLLTACGIEAIIPQKNEPQPPGLGRDRWPVERAIAWLRQFRRLRIRWDKTRRHPRSLRSNRLLDHRVAATCQNLVLTGSSNNLKSF